MLVLAKIKLSQAKPISGVAPKCLELITHADDVLTQSLDYTRTLVADLAPPVLYDHGLPDAITWLAEHMRRHHSLVITVSCTGCQRLALPEDQAVLLFQSVRELLMNTVKHAQVDRASVTLERCHGALSIVVQDEGSGIELSIGSSTTVLSSKFGLFSIRERMNALGGRFELTSTPGQGTTVTLTLPLLHDAYDEVNTLPSDLAGVERRLTTMLLHSDQGARSSRIRILLVDDHAMVRQGIRSMLSNYADIDVVGEAGNGEDAVSAVETLHPTVVLMDINMPKMNGIEATRSIKARHPHLPIIGLSVQASSANEAALLQAGAAMLITKEAAVDELYKAIRRVLEKWN